MTTAGRYRRRLPICTDGTTPARRSLSKVVGLIPAIADMVSVGTNSGRVSSNGRMAATTPLMILSASASERMVWISMLLIPASMPSIGVDGGCVLLDCLQKCTEPLSAGHVLLADSDSLKSVAADT